MKKKKNGVVILATQPTNMGDLLINKSLTDYLSEHLNLYIDKKGVPDSFSEFLMNENIEDLNKFGFSFKGFSALKFIFFTKVEFDYLFFSPGPQGGVTSLKSIIRSIFILILFLMLKLKGVKSFHVGVDMNNYSSIDVIIYKIKTKFLGVKYFVRSKTNMNAIKQLKIKNVEFIPDLAFLHERAVDNTVEKDVVGISFRDFESDVDNESIYKRIAEVVDYYTNVNSKKIEFFYQVVRDKSFTKKLYNNYKSSKNISFRNEVLWYDDIPEYNKFEVVFSNRLHVLLLGFDYNAIPIALLNSNRKLSKIYNIFEGLEMTKFIRTLEKNQTEFYDFISTNKEHIVESQMKKYQDQHLLSKKIFEEILQ